MIRFFAARNIYIYFYLQKAVVNLKCVIPDAIDRVQKICNDVACDRLDDFERASLASRTREILMQGYKFGFEVK